MFVYAVNQITVVYNDVLPNNNNMENNHNLIIRTLLNNLVEYREINNIDDIILDNAINRLNNLIIPNTYYKFNYLNDSLYLNLLDLNQALPHWRYWETIYFGCRNKNIGDYENIDIVFHNYSNGKASEDVMIKDISMCEINGVKLLRFMGDDINREPVSYFLILANQNPLREKPEFLIGGILENNLLSLNYRVFVKCMLSKNPLNGKNQFKLLFNVSYDNNEYSRIGPIDLNMNENSVIFNYPEINIAPGIIYDQLINVRPNLEIVLSKNKLLKNHNINQEFLQKRLNTHTDIIENRRNIGFEFFLENLINRGNMINRRNIENIRNIRNYNANKKELCNKILNIIMQALFPITLTIIISCILNNTDNKVKNNVSEISTDNI